MSGNNLLCLYTNDGVVCMQVEAAHSVCVRVVITFHVCVPVVAAPIILLQAMAVPYMSLRVVVSQPLNALLVYQHSRHLMYVG